MPSPYDDPGGFQIVLIILVAVGVGALLNDLRHRIVVRIRNRHHR